MDVRLLRRAAALAIATFLMSATAVFADSIPADGDALVPGNQGLVDLGAMGPGQTVTRTVTFTLVCSGSTHAVPGQTATITPSSFTKPLDGTMSSTATTIGPVPPTWPAAGAPCGSPVPVLPANGPVTVTIKTPTTAGIDYLYSVIYARVGMSGLSGSTAITFMVDVVTNTPPVLTMPAPISVEATGPAGAAVSYTASATDAEDNPDPTPTCSPASGATFPLGTTNVSCSVTDSGGLTAMGAFPVTVRDTTAPALTLPGPISAEATSPVGATVSFGASATDIVDPAPAVACAPPSGSDFALGTTTVDCTATDASGNQSAGSFPVTVVDTTAPTLSVPAGVSEEATGPSGAAVTYAASATDVADPAPAVLCSPGSGSTFALGTTSVTCTATDASGNVATAAFDVVVGDSGVPSLVLPGTLTAEATGPSGAAVSFTVTTTDTVDPVPVVTCSQASGSMFGLGTTSVACTATDASGNHAWGSFDVVVRDTTPPAMTGVPADISVSTTNAAGRSVSWSSPSATDAVSGGVAVDCSPSSGSTFAVGTKTVACTATDPAGNGTTRSFTVTVTFAETTVYEVQWGEPISGGTLSANQSRTVPLKFRLFVDGVEVTSGNAVLTIAPCGGGSTVLTVPLSFNGDRWTGHLDTSSLNPGCYVATAVVGGATAGSFQLDLRGAEPASTPKPMDKPKK
jgi:hypothetical protein